MKSYGVLLAGGSGSRVGGAMPKQFINLADGRTMLEHAVAAFVRHKGIDEVILVAQEACLAQAREVIHSAGFDRVCRVIPGGATRQESSFLGVSAIEEGEALVLIHDVARPFVSEVVIDRVLQALASELAVSVATPVTDTIYRVDESGFIAEIPPRSELWGAQTPQGFRKSVMLSAHEMARRDGVVYPTDDAGLVLHYRLARIFVVQGDAANRKVTYAQDLDQ